MSDNQYFFVLQDGQPDILYTFWNNITTTLSEEFHKATEGKTVYSPVFTPVHQHLSGFLFSLRFKQFVPLVELLCKKVNVLCCAYVTEASPCPRARCALGELSPKPADTSCFLCLYTIQMSKGEHWTGYPCVTGLTRRHTRIFTPVVCSCMFLDCGRKPEYAGCTQTAQYGSEPTVVL